jgi:hypothetical protein
MARGRPPTPATPAVVVELNQEALQDANQAAAKLVVIQQQIDSHVRLVAQQLGYQLPADATDPDLIQRDIAANMRRSVEACLEVGRGLSVLKEACGHGNFVARLDVLGIDDGVARKFMQAARKFTKRSTSSVLAAVGNQSKLFELLVLDDEEIEELELTGQTGELILDEVSTMSVKELRQKVRGSKQDIEAKDTVIKSLSEKNNELQEQLARPFKPREDALAKSQEEQSLLDELQTASFGLSASIGRLMVVVDATMNHSSEAMQTAGRQAVDLACQMLAQDAERFGIRVNLDELVRPEWLDMAALDELTRRNEAAAAKNAKG